MRDDAPVTPTRRRIRLPAAVLCAALLACAALAPAAGASKGKVFKMTREDMRITLNVEGDRVVHVHIRARERCGEGRNATSGFLEFDLPRAEAVPIRDDHFHYGVNFDDARGNGVLVLEGLVHRRTITGVFLFRNREDPSCGTGRPGYRRVLYTARLQA
jgi:hypothetical protein